MKIKIKDIIVENRVRKDFGDIETLKNSIQEQGLLQSIGITDKNELVFGERRLKACEELGWTNIDCKIVNVTSIVEGENDENMIRKDFTKSELVAITEVLEKEIGNRQGQRTDLGLVDPGPQVKTRDIVGDKIGKSGREVDRIKTVVKSDNTDLIDMMDSEVISTKDCVKVTKESPEMQNKIIQKIKNEDVKNVGMAIKTIREEKKVEEYKNSDKTKPIIYNKDYKDFLLTIEDNSIDLLITDPPYFTEDYVNKDFAEEWITLSLRKIKDEGRAFIFIGAYPKEIHAYLSILLKQNKFIIDNPIIWTYRNTLGQTPKMKYNLNYQMCLHLYSKNSRELDTSITNEMFSVQDINAPDGRIGDRYYKWQKPDELSERLIRHSTLESDKIIDPFAGSGSFLLAASRINRDATGCEKDSDVYNIAIKIIKENDIL